MHWRKQHLTSAEERMQRAWRADQWRKAGDVVLFALVAGALGATLLYLGYLAFVSIRSS